MAAPTPPPSILYSARVAGAQPPIKVVSTCSTPPRRCRSTGPSSRRWLSSWRAGGARGRGWRRRPLRAAVVAAVFRLLALYACDAAVDWGLPAAAWSTLTVLLRGNGSPSATAWSAALLSPLVVSVLTEPAVLGRLPAWVATKFEPVAANVAMGVVFALATAAGASHADGGGAVARVLCLTHPAAGLIRYANTTAALRGEGMHSGGLGGSWGRRRLRRPSARLSGGRSISCRRRGSPPTHVGHATARGHRVFWEWPQGGCTAHAQHGGGKAARSRAERPRWRPSGSAQAGREGVGWSDDTRHGRPPPRALYAVFPRTPPR